MYNDYYVRFKMLCLCQVRKINTDFYCNCNVCFLFGSWRPLSHYIQKTQMMICYI